MGQKRPSSTAPPLSRGFFIFVISYKNPPVSINPDREMTGFDSHKREKFQFFRGVSPCRFFHRRRRNLGNTRSRLWIFKILCTQFPRKKSGERRCPVDNMKFCTISTGFSTVPQPWCTSSGHAKLLDITPALINRQIVQFRHSSSPERGRR